MSKLFEAVNIGGVELKNRLVMSPMCMYKAEEDGFVRDFHIIHYATRAIGGIGLIIVEATAVEPGGRITDHDLGLWNDEQMEGLHALVATVHHYGAKIGIQIGHAGRKSTVTNSKPVAPSAIKFAEGYRTPREMKPEDISFIKACFLSAAKRAVECGFDILEVHAAHGYLLHEFLSPLTNKREDEYGGSLENRARMLTEIVSGIKKLFPDVSLFVRMSVTEWLDGGFDIEESVQVAKWLKELGVCLIDVSTGGSSMDVDYSKIFRPMYQAEFSEIIKHKSDIATGAVGLITKPEECEQIINDDMADLVFLGRELLRNPYFAVQAQKELEHEPFDVDSSYERAYK